MTEDRGQNTESRVQGTGGQGQGTEDLGQETGSQGQKTADQGLRTENQDTGLGRGTNPGTEETGQGWLFLLSPYQLFSNNLVVTKPEFFNCRSREKKKEKKRDRSRSRDRHHKKHKKERQVFIKLQCSSDFHVLYFTGHERGEDQHRDPGLEKASRRVKMTTTVRN